MILQPCKKSGTQPVFFPQKLRIAYKESVCVWGGGGACSLIDLGFVNSQTKFFAKTRTLFFPHLSPFNVYLIFQGWNRLEKYLNLEGFLEKSLKTKSALKVLENHSKALKSLNFSFFL